MVLLNYSFLCLAMLTLASNAQSQDNIIIRSNNAAVSLQLQSDKDGQVKYSITCNGEQVMLPSGLGFTLNKPAIALNRFDKISIDSSSTDETWEPVWGEVKSIRNS